MEKTLVSICIPTYKQPKSLERLLNSIVDQTYKNYEVIISDDTPSNSVKDVYTRYGSKFKNIHYYKNKQPKGSPGNWNEVVKHATGKYVKIMHHDDWFSTADSLKEFVELLSADEGVDFAFCASANYTPTGKLKNINTITPKQVRTLQNDPRILFCGNFVGGPSATIFRKSLNLEFDERFKWIVDTDFYIRALLHRPNFAYTCKPLVCVQIESDEQITYQASNNKYVVVTENLHLYDKIREGKPLNIFYLNFIWILFKRFNIQSIEDIRECGYWMNINLEIAELMKLNNKYKILLHLLLLPLGFLKYLEKVFNKFVMYSLGIIDRLWIAIAFLAIIIRKKSLKK